MRMPSLSVPTFKATKQWIKQKIGAADRTQEDEDFLARLRHLDHLDAYLRRIFVQAKRTTDRWQNALTASETLVELCKAGKEGDTKENDCARVGLARFDTAMDNLIQHDELIDSNIAKFNKLHAELLRDQIERVLATEAADALKAKTAYYHSVLEYDACRANLAAAEKQAHLTHGPPNVAHAKEYLKIAKAEYENKKNAMINAVKHLDNVVERDLADTFEAYVRNKRLSFLRLGSHLEDLQITSFPERRNEEDQSDVERTESAGTEHEIDRRQGGGGDDGDGAKAEANVAVSVTSKENSAEADPLPAYYDIYTASSVERRY
eukprot:CAMPEP_0184489962 /NCGR_PEP_ID=MMETSP0113_2-20130426/16777_1 /TAXON_ID=91329 /ORGANISM="Norrisiella sphaerica, Strain BC52" /LENGTH=320 /DNA_ID=CAMNT_0026873649 /DNA_START=184 /DNA_END=1146 /DNA_ORIENTATION=+